MSAPVPAGAAAVRRLGPPDLAAFRPLRLEALRRHPEAFGSSYEEEAGLTPDDVVRMFLPTDPPNGTFGAFVDGRLGGIAGLHVVPKIKQRHIGNLIAVYVAPAHRRAGLARMLAQAVEAEARSAGLLVLQLTVTIGNEAARRLYADLGFMPYGVHRRALKVGDVLYDNEQMALDLR